MFGIGWIWRTQQEIKNAKEEAKKKAVLKPLKYGDRVEVISGFFEGIKGEVKNFRDIPDIVYQVYLDCEQFYFSARGNLQKIDKEK